MRWAFIRVSSKNITKSGEEITYTKKDIENILKEWNLKKQFNYWFIEHTQDETTTQTHFHIVLRFDFPSAFHHIKKQFPYGDIQKAKNLKRAIQYLIHLNHPKKKQYKWDDIITNSSIEPYMPKFNESGILDQIMNGEIRQYNLTQAVPGWFYIQHKSKIEKALEYFIEKQMMDKKRNINVIFIEGPAGTGKTLFATYLAEKLDTVYFLSSSNNDPLQDLKGEPCAILDDLRENSFSFNDLLKVIDNHNNSTIKSRYRNKPFLGDLIIITSAKPLDDWYKSINNEDRYQLIRRIGEVYKIDHENVHIYRLSEESKKHIYIGSFENPKKKILKEKDSKRTYIYEELGIPLTNKLSDYSPYDFVVNHLDPDQPF